MNYTLFIIVPCYNEKAMLNETTTRLSQILENMQKEGLVSDHSRILYVDDGSVDSTWSMIDGFCQTNPYVCGVKQAGNAGHQNALMAGLENAVDQAHILITVDADLQDYINLIPEMVRKYDAGYDNVCGVRSDRDTDSFLHRKCAYGFYRMMNFLGTKTIFNHADYRLMSKRAVKQLCKFCERNLYLRGMILKVGYKHTCVYYSRAKRFAGEIHFPYSKLIGLALEDITSFSVKPLRLIFMAGLILVLLSVLLFTYVIRGVVVGKSVDGWPFVIMSIWLVAGLLMNGLGILGEYIGKIYLEVKDCPRYNIEKMERL